MSYSGCERNEEAVIPSDASKLAGKWKLVGPSSAYTVTLQLTTDSTVVTIPEVLAYQLNGRSSVNSYFSKGTFAHLSETGNPNQGQASVGVIGATKMAGPPEAMQFETAYFNNLKAVNRFELTNQNRLKLFYGGEQPGVLTYERTK
ncbi:META domain-containing protein [Tellurirhabdus bombi]|uniref:META domain-containing protein n=1 Tax=Tellurirhabdus bombi TaxID=2907205 RepID=UPI001F3CC836|nr:META domain-containing protein [Tellurirhabdus bombi]